MRKFATFAALALCAGTIVAGEASAADAAINIGGDLTPAAAADPTQISGSMDFAKTWCGAPWLWTGQQSDAGCAGAQHHDQPSQ